MTSMRGRIIRCDDDPGIHDIGLSRHLALIEDNNGAGLADIWYLQRHGLWLRRWRYGQTMGKQTACLRGRAEADATSCHT